MTMTQREIDAVLYDLSWLDRCICDQRPLRDFFVSAGHVMPAAARRVALNCPTRRQEIIFAYGRDIRWGYFGALSPGQRASMSLDEALALAEAQSESPAR